MRLLQIIFASIALCSFTNQLEFIETGNVTIKCNSQENENYSTTQVQKLSQNSIFIPEIILTVQEIRWNLINVKYNITLVDVSESQFSIQIDLPIQNLEFQVTINWISIVPSIYHKLIYQQFQIIDPITFQQTTEFPIQFNPIVAEDGEAISPLISVYLLGQSIQTTTSQMTELKMTSVNQNSAVLKVSSLSDIQINEVYVLMIIYMGNDCVLQTYRNFIYNHKYNNFTETNNWLQTQPNDVQFISQSYKINIQSKRNQSALSFNLDIIPGLSGYEIMNGNVDLQIKDSIRTNEDFSVNVNLNIGTTNTETFIVGFHSDVLICVRNITSTDTNTNFIIDQGGNEQDSGLIYLIVFLVIAILICAFIVLFLRKQIKQNEKKSQEAVTLDSQRYHPAPTLNTPQGLMVEQNINQGVSDLGSCESNIKKTEVQTGIHSKRHSIVMDKNEDQDPGLDQNFK